MITVLLQGAMGKQFGRRHRLDISTPAEALRALQANYPGFRAWLIKHRETPFRVLTGSEAIDASGLGHCTGKTIKFVPLIGGRGTIGRIILGAVLIYFSAGIGAAFATELISASTISGLVTNLGVSLILGGLSQLLFKPPKREVSNERPDNKPSYVFDGAVNTVAQGNCVPVLYGELIVGSQVISSGLSVEQLS